MLKRNEQLYLSFLLRGIWLRRSTRNPANVTWGDAIGVTPSDVKVIRDNKAQLLEVIDAVHVGNWKVIEDPRGGAVAINGISAEFALAMGESA